jgi:hypothetical protein
MFSGSALGRKRTRSQTAQAAREAYIDSVVSHLFENVSDREKWEVNIRLAANIVTRLVESAERLRVTDADIVKSIINDFILTDSSQSQVPNNEIYFSLFNWKSADTHAEIFRNRIQDVSNRLNSVDIDALLATIFREPDPSLRKEMFLFWLDEPLIAECWVHLRDMAAICRFLGDVRLVDKYLSQLEGCLQEKAKVLSQEFDFSTDNEGRLVLFTQNAPAENRYQRYKLLSSYLDGWADENGFKQKAKIIRALSRKEFFHLLLSKSWIKDSAYDLNVNEKGDHGIWTHALQWYCVFEHHKASHFLKTDPIKLYQQFAGGSKSKIGSFTGNLWRTIFDNFKKANYTCPEYVTERIISNSADQWPLLSETVYRAQQKMKANAAEFGLFKYMKMKHPEARKKGVVLTRLSHDD